MSFLPRSNHNFIISWSQSQECQLILKENYSRFQFNCLTEEPRSLMVFLVWMTRDGRVLTMFWPSSLLSSANVFLTIFPSALQTSRPRTSFWRWRVFFNFRLDDQDIGIFQKLYHSVDLILEFPKSDYPPEYLKSLRISWNVWMSSVLFERKHTSANRHTKLLIQ